MPSAGNDPVAGAPVLPTVIERKLEEKKSRARSGRRIRCPLCWSHRKEEMVLHMRAVRERIGGLVEEASDTIPVRLNRDGKLYFQLTGEMLASDPRDSDIPSESSWRPSHEAFLSLGCALLC
jgi:hypothetical protein